MKADILSKQVTEVFTGSTSDPGIPEMLELIGRLTPKVNEVTDKANSLIRSIEQHLTKTGAGVDARVEVDPSCMVPCYHFEAHTSDNLTQDEREAVGLRHLLMLVHCRSEGGFRLGIRELVDWTSEEGDEHTDCIFDRPLLECPRDKKLYIVHFLPQLLFKIAAQLQEMSASADRLLSDEAVWKGFKESATVTVAEFVREGTERVRLSEIQNRNRTTANPIR